MAKCCAPFNDKRNQNIFLDPVNRQHFDNMLRKPFIRIDLRVRHNQNAHEDEEDVDA